MQIETAWELMCGVPLSKDQAQDIYVTLKEL